MKLTSITGVDQIEGVNCFKPISKVFIKTDYGDGVIQGYHEDPLIRVRLIDGRTGSSTEIVPEMKLSILSEIASKYEGFQRKAAITKNGSDDTVVTGFSLSSVIIGQQLDETIISAVDLSNDKYISIDMKGLNPDVTYEIWGMESHIINSFCRIYKKFYLSAGEIEKVFNVGDNEVLVYPIDQIKELQMFAKNGQASPTYRREELIIDEDGRNDLVSVELTKDNRCVFNTGFESGALPIRFGYSTWGVMSITDFSRFEVRRDDGLATLTFLMIDTVPSVPSAIIAE